jgi:hypothetical protein
MSLLGRRAADRGRLAVIRRRPSSRRLHGLLSTSKGVTLLRSPFAFAPADIDVNLRLSHCSGAPTGYERPFNLRTSEGRA